MNYLTKKQKAAIKSRRAQDLVLVALAECGGWAYAADIEDELIDQGFRIPMNAIAFALTALEKAGVVVSRPCQTRSKFRLWNLSADAEDDE